MQLIERLLILLITSVFLPIIILVIAEYNLKNNHEYQTKSSILHTGLDKSNIFIYLVSIFHNAVFIYGFEDVWTGLLYIPILWLLGAIPAAIASRKGRSFWNWLCYGMMCFLVAIIHAIFLRPRS